MLENKLSHEVIGAAIEVHKILGPGLLESTYHRCLMRELYLRGIDYEIEAPVAVEYKGEVVTDAYRLDFLVGNHLIVELKAVEKINKLHKSQVLTYLRLTKRKLGLLINFNEVVLKNGVKRIVNQL